MSEPLVPRRSRSFRNQSNSQRAACKSNLAARQQISDRCQYLRTREHLDSTVLSHFREDNLSRLISAVSTYVYLDDEMPYEARATLTGRSEQRSEENRSSNRAR